MRRVLVALLASCALLASGPVWAALPEPGLLRGQPMLYHGETVTVATDGDLSTYHRIQAGHGAERRLLYAFPQPVHVTRVYVAYQKSYSGGGVRLRLFNGVPDPAWETSLPGSNNQKIERTWELDLHGVSSIEVFDPDGEGALYVFEVDVYGDMEEPPPPPPPDPPLVPGGVTATAGDGQVTVTWGAVAGADGYDVEYRRASGVWIRAVTGHQGTAFTIEGLENGQAYEFRVRATNAGGTSDWSGVVTATPEGAPDLEPPDPPRNVRASADSLGNLVEWEASPSEDVASYRVYRAEGDQSFSRIGGTTELRFRDAAISAGTIYRYQVTAVDRAGNESEPSAVVEVEGVADRYGALIGSAASSGGGLLTALRTGFGDLTLAMLSLLVVVFGFFWLVGRLRRAAASAK